MSNQLLAGKRGLIMGLANDKSIAWGIAKACADAGAEMAFSYMGDQFKKRVVPLADQLGDREGVLLTREGDGHTAYSSGNRCIVKAVDAYLVDGTVPRDGTTCPDE